MISEFPCSITLTSDSKISSNMKFSFSLLKINVYLWKLIYSEHKNKFKVTLKTISSKFGYISSEWRIFTR
jgi:hypothetical protein